MAFSATKYLIALVGICGYCYCLSVSSVEKRSAESLYDNIYSAISAESDSVGPAAVDAAAVPADAATGEENLPENVRTIRQIAKAGGKQEQRKVVVVEGFPSGLPEGTPEGVKIALASALPPDQMPPIPGVAGTDYPTFASVPETGFACSGQSHLPGIYGDTAAQCQTFFMCQADGNSNSFLCPNGTIFNQQYFICDWWYNVDCSATQNFYSLNEFLYKDQPAGKKCTSLFCSQD